MEAVLYRYRAGVAWPDLPERFGHRAASGVWERVFAALSADADNECALLDATIARAHRHSAGARKTGAATRRSGGVAAA